MIIHDNEIQYPVAWPSSSITQGSTFFKCPMYLLHLATSTVSQNFCMPSTKACFVVGLISLLRYSFSSCHRFSIGFISGDSGGVFHQFTLFSNIKALARFEVCFGSLSYMNLWPSGKRSRRKGSSVACNMSVYKFAFMIPSKMQMPVAPFKLIPAQMWTFTGCLALRNNNNYYACFCFFCKAYLGFGLGTVPCLWQQNRRCVSCCTVHSSVKITSLKW